MLCVCMIPGTREDVDSSSVPYREDDSKYFCSAALLKLSHGDVDLCTMGYIFPKLLFPTSDIQTSSANIHSTLLRYHHEKGTNKKGRA